MRRIFTLLAVLLAMVVLMPIAAAQDATPAASPSAGCTPSTEEENIETARRWLDIWNSKDVSLYEGLVHPDTVHHFGQGPDTVGLAALQEGVQRFFTAFPDLELVQHEVIADGDFVVIRFTNTGTHLGQFLDLEPLGGPVTWTGINIFRFECGQVVESWSEVDGVGVREQLTTPGNVVTPAASPPAVVSADGECVEGTEDANAATAQQYLDVWNSKDVSLFDDLAHPEVVHHWGQGQDTTGLDALKASTEAFFTAFPDMVMTFDETIVDGDLVVIRWTLDGTQTGSFFELEPSGVQATWTGINIYRIACGQVVESWSEADGVGLRQQLQAPDGPATPAP